MASIYTENTQLLLKVIFNIQQEVCNLPELDGKPCGVCQQIPQIILIKKKLKNGKIILAKDRSNRIDTDRGNGITHLVTYHRTCWQQAMQSDILEQ